MSVLCKFSFRFSVQASFPASGFRVLHTDTQVKKVNDAATNSANEYIQYSTLTSMYLNHASGFDNDMT